MKQNKNKWILGGLLAVLLVAAALLQRAQSSAFATLPAANFADAKPTGGKGLALLLNRIGYQAKVQDAPLQTMPADARVWLMLGPKNSFTKREAGLLLDWVKAGGTLVYCVDRGNLLDFSFNLNAPKKPVMTGVETVEEQLKIKQGMPDFASYGGASGGVASELPELPAVALDVPSNARAGVKSAVGAKGNFGIARAHVEIAGAPGGTIARIPLGKGQVWAVPNAWIFTNYGLSKPDTAVLVSNLLRTQASPAGARNAVYFDERAHDESGRPPLPDTLINRLKQPPISYAIWQLFFAGVLLWVFAARRLGAAVPLPTRGPVTRASQFAQAMGALFAQTSRPSAAADIISGDFRKRLASRIGLSILENDGVLAQRAHELSGVPYEVVDRLLLQTRTPATSDAQALRDAQEMDAVLKRLEGEV